jgi:hypothetical protein
MYTITDSDGLTASAFIHVPAKGSLPPTLRSTKPIEVKSGQTVEVPLADYVRAADGGRVVITEAAKVSAVHANGDGLVKDQTTLVYTSANGYFGPDALTFEVTDGTGPDDPKGHKATLTIPITVLPPGDQPPTFVNGQLSVAPGEDAASLDLRGLTSDPDKGDLAKVTYQLVGGAPSGLNASIDGGTLKVSAPADAKKGTGATLHIRLTDGRTDPVDGEVAVSITASTRPLATANDDVVAEAHQGTTVSVPVLDNDFNPFPDKPLKVVSASTVTGDGQATVSGSKVDVAIAKDYVGTLVVRYRVQDATADVDREVEGRIVLTVQGRPAQPGKPTVTSVQDRTVVLNWTPPVDNGAEITGYTVQSLAGGYSKKCASTTCTLDGLTNNVEYNFTVTATNGVGTSDASLPSETARPDARPDTPQAPTLVFGDKSLAVSWKTPTTPGSPVESYNLEISPAPPSGAVQRTGVTGNTLTWTGLENGTDYRVRVQAVNKAPEPSSWSAWSLGETPAAAPAAPAAPTTNRLDPVPPQAQIEVVWIAPANNGDAISGYEVQVLQGGAVQRTVPVSASQTRQAIPLPTSTTDYTFKVRAQNKAGWSAWSAASAPKRAFIAPGQPTDVTASTPKGDSSIVVSYTAAQGNGATASEVKYEYSLNGGAWKALTSTTIGGLNNGTTYTVRLQAYTSMDGVRYTGDPSAPSNGAVPYGPVNTPGATATASGQSITYAWKEPAANGRAITKVEYSIDGGAWTTASPMTGSVKRDVGYSHTGTIRVRAYDAAGQVSAIASDSATSVAKPQATADSGHTGDAQGQPGCSSSGCAYGTVTVHNFPAGNYTLSCNGTGPFGGRWGERTYYVPTDGTVQLGCYFGGAGYDFWINIAGWGDATHTTW